MTTGHDAGPASGQQSNAYQIFIFVLTILSLVLMVAMWLPLNAETINLLRWYDNLICFVFLGDFGFALFRAPSKRVYFLHERGWLDLLGSIPAFPGVERGGILRLARLSRLGRIARLLRGQNKEQLIHDLLGNRAQYAVLITLLSAFLVLTISSTIVLNAESRSPTANITTGGDAIWWAIVTITTVGYGDTYPTTVVGRTTAVFVMFMGVGIIGSLASIMASLLVNPSNEESSAEPTPTDGKLDTLAAELVAARAELAALRRLVERQHDETTSDLATARGASGPPPR